MTVGPTLTALLGHPRNQDLVLLTPQIEGRVRVTSALLARDVTTRPEDSHGTLLILLEDVARSDWRLDALVSRAEAAGVAGLVLPGHEPPGVPTQLLAGRLALPLLGTPDPLQTYHVLNDLLARPLVEEARLVRATVAACAGAGDPASVVHEVTTALGRPVALLDHAARAVVGPELVPEEERDAVLDHLVHRSTPPEHPRTAQTESGEVVGLTVTEGQSWLCVALGETSVTERDAILAALPIAVGALRERLAERRLQLERDARARTSALDQIVRHPTTPSVSLRRRALDLGWQLDGWHIGIYIALAGESDLMAARTDLISAFAGEGLEIQAVEQVDGWGAWTTSERQPSSEDAVRHATAVRRAQRRFEATSAVATSVGVGRARNGPEGIAASLLEASDAARLARSHDETGRFLHVDRLGFGRLLLGWTRTDSFRPAATALLEPLSRAPGDLTATLGTYLDFESSLAHSAAVLGVHRNTVAARIARVQELLGVNLEDPDERLALHLACKSLDLPERAVQNTT